MGSHLVDTYVLLVLLVFLLDQLQPHHGHPTTERCAHVNTDSAATTHDEAQEVGELLYRVAAGELFFEGVKL